jgi:hypothetical protein
MLFVADYGYQAAAYTTLFSYALMAVLAWIINDYWMKHPPLPLLKIILSLIPLVAITIVFYRLGWEKAGMDIGLIAIKLLAMLVFGVILFYDTLKKLFRS